MSVVGASVLTGIGAGLRRLAGPLLPPMIEALVAPLEATAALVRPPTNGRPGPALVDLAVTPFPRQLGQMVGVKVPAGLSTEEARAAVTGRGVSRRGTAEALKAAVATTLTGSKTVTLVERNGSAYRVLVRTYTAETPDPARTLAAALSEKPIGLRLFCEVAEGLTWDQLTREPEVANLTWAQATDITWEELGMLVPNEVTG